MVSVTPTSSEPRTAHPVLAQAPVKALDPDGLSVICGGTVCFAVATVVLWAVFWDGLAAGGQLWRFWIAVVGTAMGVIGLVVTLTLGRRRRAARHPQPEAPGTAD